MLLSAKELDERTKAKRSVKKELYTRILTQMCRKIDMQHSLGGSECMLHIPEYIFGYPSFNMTEMTMYIYRQLVRLGYRTSILNIGVLYTAWGPKRKAKPKKTTTSLATFEDELPNLANLKKAADSLRKKYTEHTK